VEYSNLVLILLTVKAVIIGKDEVDFALLCYNFATEKMSQLDTEIDGRQAYQDWLNNAGKDN
jgi:hypothetical protein